MGKNFFISCDEATTICDKSQYDEASLYDKIRLSIHLAFCKHCKDYTKQNRLMSDLFGRFATPCEGSDRMPEEDKNELELKLKEELKKK
jgi:hypothetical protein